MKLLSYKLAVETGFAPNPFGCTLTLATCKPGIRRSKNRRIGDWIAGFTSGELNGDAVGKERLIYLMKVGDKLLFRNYFYDERFQDKIPNMKAKGALAKAGDNIYKPLHAHRLDAINPSHFEQIPNLNHCKHDHDPDVSGKYVLIADEFYYFGCDALELPNEIRPKIPTGQHPYGWLTHDIKRAQRLIEFVRERVNGEPGRHGLPHSWPKESIQGNGI